MLRGHPATTCLGRLGRVVFDCSVKYRGSSLNDKLLQGPDLTNFLVGVLMRFRQEPVALMADVEAMFHQVRVKPGDASALRFLWWPDGDLDSEPEEHMMTVHLFGVDDCLKSVNSDDDAINLVKDLTELLKTGGFRFTKWLSNSRQVMESIPDSERAKSVKNLDFGHAPIERALGVQWCISSDTF